MKKTEAIKILKNTTFIAPSMVNVDTAINMAVHALETNDGVHAHWNGIDCIGILRDGVAVYEGYCSNCNMQSFEIDGGFCPNCGAVMDEEVAHEMCFDFEKNFRCKVEQEDKS